MQGEDSINRYISLHEATKYCHYSQEYLSLRVRQGKLKAIKSGRNWVTKKEWVEEYVKKVGDYNNNLKIKKSVLPAETLVKAGAPPENLPIDPADQSADLRGYQRGFTLKEFFKISQPRFALVVGLTFVLLTAGVVFGKENLKSVFEDLDPYVQKIVGSFDKRIVKGWERINQGVGEIGEVGDLAIKEVFERAKGVVFETSSRLEEFNQDFGNGVVQLNQKLKVLEGIPLKAVSYGAGKIQRLAGNVSGYTYIVGEAGDIVIEEIGKSFTGSFAAVAEDIQNLQSQLKNSAKFVSKSFLEELSFFTELSRSGSESGEEEIFFDSTLRFARLNEGIVEIESAISAGKENVRYGGLVIAVIASPETAKETFAVFKEYGNWLNENLKSSAFAIKASADRQISKIKNLSRDSYTILRDKYLAANDFLERKITQGYRMMTQLFEKPTEPKEEKLTPQPAKEGMVVIPSSEKDEQIIQKIKASFSDEVKVKPKDETSGIIIPVFRGREGEKYLYILLPIQN